MVFTLMLMQGEAIMFGKLVYLTLDEVKEDLGDEGWMEPIPDSEMYGMGIRLYREDAEGKQIITAHNLYSSS